MSGLDLSALGLRSYEDLQSATDPRGRQDLGQNEFLTLLVTQLKNQDPLNPMDNEAFVAQLAQFSTVSGVTKSADTLSRIEALFASGGQASAASWIGRTVSTADGASGEVSSIGFADDGAITLNLADGSSLPMSAVTSLA